MHSSKLMLDRLPSPAFFAALAIMCMLAPGPGCHASISAGESLSDAVEVPDEPNLRVMSFNIRYDNPWDGGDRWSRRQGDVVTTIRDFDPDLLGTQEALANQHDFLSESLDDYTAHGVGRNDGYRDNEFVTIFYRTDRFTRRTEGHFWLSETPHVPGSRGWDAALPRMVSWVWLNDEQTGREVVVLNTHWDHRGNEARERSAHVMREFIAGFPEEVAVIVMGDFNRVETQTPYHVMTAGREDHDDRRLIDSYRAVHPEREDDEATYHGFDGRTAGSRIDWILVSQEFRVLDAAIDRRSFDGRYPSDHYPVTAELYLAE